VNRILVLDGYTNPFGDSRRKSQHHLGGNTMKRRRSYRGMQQSKMKSCAAEYRKAGKPGKYISFMKKCLKK